MPKIALVETGYESANNVMQKPTVTRCYTRENGNDRLIGLLSDITIDTNNCPTKGWKNIRRWMDRYNFLWQLQCTL